MTAATATIERQQPQLDTHDDAGSILFGRLWDDERITWDDHDIPVVR